MNLSAPQVTIKGFLTQTSIPFIGRLPYGLEWNGRLTNSNYCYSSNNAYSLFNLRLYIKLDERVTMIVSSEIGVNDIPLI